MPVTVLVFGKTGIVCPRLSYAVLCKGVATMEKTAGRRVYRRRSGQKAVLGEREKRRLLQLVACLVLFLTVFFTKGAGRLEQLRDELSMALSANVNFKNVLTDLGWSIASDRPVGETVGELWLGMFAPREKQPYQAGQGGALYRTVQAGAAPVALTRPVGTEDERVEDHTDPLAASSAMDRAESQEPQTEPAVVYVNYDGPALPDNTTMDRYNLGLSETVSPVMARVTSGFGWREDPLGEGVKFHNGLDLGVATGTPVLAFAAGTVDYIGESQAYGQYLQIIHENGVTTFYAHCSKLCVQKGQKVEAGEKVAESGATGDVTGPHLHFEMKKDGVRINPDYYIETEP